MLEEAGGTQHPDTEVCCVREVLQTVPQQPEQPAAGLDGPSLPAGSTHAAYLIPEQKITQPDPALVSPLPPPSLFPTLSTRKQFLAPLNAPMSSLSSPISIHFPKYLLTGGTESLKFSPDLGY